MSYKTHLRRGKEQWENWTRGLKETMNPLERQRGRKRVSQLKKATHRAERILSKRVAVAERRLAELPP